MPLLYLKPNAIAEPLFNQWYAWSYLIPPASAAMYVANSHLKILESFVEAPQVHQAALQDPAMRGGPFVHYAADRLPEIKALLEQTQRHYADLLSLAAAIQDLDRLLLQEAKGYSLEPLYGQMPPMLRGYLELVYDANHHPAMRLMEGLLYKSPYYHPEAQSLILYLSQSDRRAFVLSNPRLPDSQTLHFSIPFSDQRWDELFRMRRQPRSYAEIQEIFAIENDANDALFGSLFTADPPVQPQSTPVGIRIRYYGHACVLVETPEISILCDPLIGYQHSTGIPRYSYSDLPEVIDYVLITHNHQDHVMFETLLQLRHQVRQIIVPKSNKGSLIDPSLKLILQTIGFHNVHELDELETLTVAGGSITSLPVLGEHGDLNIGAKSAYWLDLNGQTILCAADSNNIEPHLYDHLAAQLGALDILFIGMECDGAPYTWAYGALLTQPVPRKMAQTRRLNGSNAERAMQLIQRLNPQQVYVYAMGQEPWLTHITSIEYSATSEPILESNRLVEFCRQQGIQSERLLGCREIELNEPVRSIPVQQIKPVKSPALRSPEPPSLQTWLTELANQDIKFTIEQTESEPRLRCNAPKGILTPDLQAQLKQHKAEILRFLMPSQPSLDLAAVTLAPEIQPAAVRATHPPAQILLTGATGFLGAFLLSELLQQTQAQIYCLVRAESPAAANQKLVASLTGYGLWDSALAERLVPIVGDLALPLLGLSPADFQSLAAHLDAIYHNGAWVHHTLPYPQLQATNVLGTQEILRLACQSRIKPLHFISTISVFAATHQAGIRVVQEQEIPDAERLPSSGYAQSKSVAERLAREAQTRGLPVAIYRPGAIAGHSQTGVFNVNDFLYRLIQGCIQLGSAPVGEMPLNLLPVDYASRAIIHLSRQPDLLGKSFHLVHPQPAPSTVLFDLLNSTGYPIQQVPYNQWRASLLEIAQTSPDHPLYAIMSLFSTSHTQSQSSDLPVLEFDCRNTEAGLSNSSICCPEIDPKLLNTYLSYLIQHNFIQLPELVHLSV